MSEMVKYPSIENTYQQKHIDMWLKYHPELEDETYLLTEKIHGSNLQVLFTPDEPIRYFSRNQEILPGEKFHGYQSALAEDLIQSAFQSIQKSANRLNTPIRIFGELFGKGIMKGVDYGLGDEKRFRIFASMTGGEWDTLNNMRRGQLGCGSDRYTMLFVPPVYLAGSLQEALDFDVEQPTHFNPIEGNTWEGVVIKPYYKNYQSPDGSMFWLKKKSERFKEKSHAPAPRVVDSEVDSMNALFSSYFNDNRVQSCFSKMGEIQTPKEMATHIKAIFEDGKIDFLKEHNAAFELLGKDQQKKALNVGGLIANLLKPYL